MRDVRSADPTHAGANGPVRRRRTRPRGRTAAQAVLAAVSVSAASVLVTPAPAIAVTDPHVLVIGIDGLLFDRIAPADAPNLDALIAGGYSSKTWLCADPMAPTYSGPGWATILTGVWPDKHGVLSNTWGTGTAISSYPDFISRVEQAKPALRTYADVSWTPIIDGSAGTPLITSTVDQRYSAVSDADVAENAVAQLSGPGPNLSFLHFGDVDHAGHDHGAASQQYLDAIHDVDSSIGRVLTAVHARPDYSSERWTVIVTADHGHTEAGGHGGNTPPERSSFIIANGAGFSASTPSIKPKAVDVAAETLRIFGLPIPAALDGQALSTPSIDSFDAKVGSLASRVDETGIPASVLGWSRSFPTGWAVDNSTLGSGGVTEWRGWTLTDDEFWTATDPGQGRETNVRERGVFAVADSDEWSDAAHTGLYTSVMTTPAYSVAGRTTVDLLFGSHYRKEGNEQATVRVSFNGGPWTQVLAYGSDRIAAIEKVAVTVPRNASTMKARFTLSNGDNNWYWAVDNVRVQ